MFRYLLFVIWAVPAAADWAASYRAGDALLQQGRTAAAVAEFRVALREAEGAGAADSQILALHDALGRAAYRGGNYREAKGHFESALRLAGRRTESEAIAMAGLGQSCQALGELAHAEQLYRRALEIGPGRTILWQLLAGLLVLERRYTEAESVFEKAIAVADAAAVPLVQSDLACLLEERGRLGEALELSRKAVSSAPAGQARARMLANLGMLHLKAGDRAAAVAVLSRAVEETEQAVGPAHPDVAQVLRGYEKALARVGRKAEARQAARRSAVIRSSLAAQTNSSGATVDYRDLR